MISTTGNKWSERKEEYIESTTKSSEPRRKISEMERTFQVSTRKHSWNHKQTYPKNHYYSNTQWDINLGQIIVEELDTILKKNQSKNLQASTKYILKYGSKSFASAVFHLF